MRLFNIRTSLVAAVAFIVGIFAFYEALFAKIWFGLAAVALLIVLLTVFAIKRFSAWKAVLLALIFVLLGFGRGWLCYGANTANEKLGEEVTLTGRVTDLGRNGSEYGVTYYLEACADSDGNVYRGKVKARIVTDKTIETGDVVTLDGSLRSVYPICGEVHTYYLRENVRYELSDVTLRQLSQGKLRADERVRKYVYDVTSAYMPDNGGLMYALLTGDRGAVEDADEWAFGRAGIAHLLAVSGLHVGFVAAVLCFALKRFRLRPLTECVIVAVPLLFYAYICGFSPSVMRAITMLVCVYVSRMLLSRYDMLSSVSVAALLTLCVDPFYLFDAGFQLSFMSVFGIATLYAPLNRYLTRKNIRKVVRYIADSAAVSACCITATLFVLASQGGEVALFGIFLNVLAIPIVSVAFVLGMAGLLPWVFHYALFASSALLQTVVRLSEMVSRLSFATVSFKATYLSVAIVALLLFALGGFVRLNKLGRTIFYPIVSFLLVLTVLVAYVPRRARASCFAVASETDSVVAAVSDSGYGVIAGDFSDYASVMKAVRYLENYRLKGVTLYFCHCANADVDAVTQALDRFDVREAFLLAPDASDDVTGLLAQRGVRVTRQYPNSVTGEGVYVRSVYNARLVAVTVGTVNCQTKCNTLKEIH